MVVDDKWIFAAGVMAGIDGALTLVAGLCGVEAAQRIQLDIASAPETPFNSGTPASAPAAVLTRARAYGAALRMRREATAKRFADRFRNATR